MTALRSTTIPKWTVRETERECVSCEGRGEEGRGEEGRGGVCVWVLSFLNLAIELCVWRQRLSSITCPFYAVTGVKRLKKCPEAVDSFLIIWTVCRSIATLDLGDTL
jgi:hypothetical protein